MTDDLKTLLHDRADRIDFAQPDLAAITRDGDRRARSRTLRRGATGLAVAAVTAVAVSLALPHLGGRPDTTRIGVATQPSGTTPITWVTGSVIHSGDDPIDVGLEVTSFVGPPQDSSSPIRPGSSTPSLTARSPTRPR